MKIYCPLCLTLLLLSCSAQTRSSFRIAYPEQTEESAEQWLKARGVQAGLAEKKCFDLRERAGKPMGPGLLCLREVNGITTGYIYKLKKDRPDIVWNGIIAIHNNWLELIPVLLADGDMVLKDREEGSCERALVQMRLKEESGVRFPFRQALIQACALKGHYRYHGGRYVRVPGARTELFLFLSLNHFSQFPNWIL